MIGPKKHEALRLKYEKAFYGPLKKVLKKQYSSFTSDLRNYGADAALGRMNAELWNTDLLPVITTLHSRAGVAKANQVLSDLNKNRMREKKPTFGFNAEWTKQILEYFSEHLFDKIVLPISESTKEYISRIIAKGIKEGWSIEEMVQRIEREDYLDGRVRRILRTESNRAVNYGAELGAQKYKFRTQKKWKTILDGRERHPHRFANDQTVGADDDFMVDGEPLSFPGDPKGKPENTINCRCFMEMVAVRDSNGRLVPKEPVQNVRVRGRLRAELQDILNQLQ